MRSRNVTTKTVLTQLAVIACVFTVVLVGLIQLSKCMYGDIDPIKVKKEDNGDVYIDKPVSLPFDENISSPDKVVIHKLQINPKRVLVLAGEVNSSIKSLIIKANILDQEEVSPIYVIIDSPGGSVFDGSAFTSTLKTIKSPVYTICAGMCASMAAVIHQEGTKRFMTESSVLMFHPASGGAQGTLDLMQNELTFFKTIVYRMERRVSTRWKISMDEYKQITQNELWLTSWDALDRGITDDIVYLNVDIRGLVELAVEDKRLKNIPTPSKVSRKFYWIYNE
jgi:ATP-dependent Clp protease protease subunit